MPLPLIQELVQLLAGVFGAGYVAVAYMPQPNGEVHIVTPEGHTQSRAATVRRGVGPSGRALSEGRLMMVADTARSADHDELLPGAAAVLAAPIVGAYRVYGLIAVGSKTPDLWESGDGQTLAALADMLAMAVERQPAPAPAPQRPGTEYARRLAAALVRARGPVLRMASVHERLEAAGPLTASQQTILTEHSRIAGELARSLSGDREREEGAAAHRNRTVVNCGGPQQGGQDVAPDTIKGYELLSSMSSR